jgi:hypothetical protein
MNLPKQSLLGFELEIDECGADGTASISTAFDKRTKSPFEYY